MQLNKYLAHAGVCSRRKAEEYIKQGAVTINGRVERTCGYRVIENDTVVCLGRTVIPEKKVYILLNKPAGYVTTVSDEEGRATVIDLIPKSLGRIYPVGRLDKETTGLLLLTNDGELAQRLAHPRYDVPKVYIAKLDRPFSQEDMERLKKGVMLLDGFIKPDAVEYAGKHFVVKIQIHCGKNRIVRRIFKHLGYSVQVLFRSHYAGISDKGLALGRWRFLSPYEVTHLKSLKVNKK